MLMYFFIFLALVIGTFVGMGAMLLLFSPPKDNYIEQNKRLMPPEPDPHSDVEVQKPPETPLTRKIPSKEFSMTDFNCAADGLESDKYIAAHQQQQDNAYNTLKGRKEKSCKK